jgi:dolichol-phosphate mannosyltransferase
MKNETFISVVAPLLGESELLGEFIQQTSDVLAKHYSNYEIIFIDDNSSQKNSETLKKLLQSVECIRVLKIAKCESFDIAATAGLDSAIGDYAVIMDSAMDSPRLIPQLVELSASGSGIAVGINKVPLQKSILANTLSKVFHWYFEKYVGVNLIPGSTHFRALSRRVVNAIIEIKGKYRKIRYLSTASGFESAQMPYVPNKVHRLTFWNLFSESAEMLIANSAHPMRVLSILGLLASSLNLVYILYVIITYVIKKDVAPGWTTLSLQAGGMFFLLFALLAMMGEYLGRILSETRIEPVYKIQDELNSSVLLKQSEKKRNVVLSSN